MFRFFFTTLLMLGIQSVGAQCMFTATKTLINSDGTNCTFTINYTFNKDGGSNNGTLTITNNQGVPSYVLSPCNCVNHTGSFNITIPCNQVLSLTANYSNNKPCPPVTIPNVPLPVELISFEYEKKSNGTLLNWQTITEVNSDYFEVQRSVDGVHFVKLGIVQAANVSSELRDYTYLETEITHGLMYYRLKIVDLDGSYEYSKVLEATHAITDESAVYPTSAHRGEDISVSAPNIKSVKVYTSAMHKVYERHCDGSSNAIISTTNLNSGLYFIQINNSIHKFVVH